jgi:hypothetical protein
MDKTTDDVYERLARTLDELPNGFPRTYRKGSPPSKNIISTLQAF